MLAFFRTLLACIIGFFISIILIFVILIGIAAASGDKVHVKENSVLVLELNEDIPERPVDNPFLNFPGISDNFDVPVSLKEILDNVKHAKEDGRIKGIYLTADFVQAGYPTLEEIRNALIDFKKSGKFVYSYAELYTQKSYYLASVADSIFINPNGAFSFAGFHSEQIFFKGLFEKLDIQPKLIRAGKYKSAGETFIKDQLSKENRYQLEEYLNSGYTYYLSKIAEARKVGVEELRNIANNLVIKYPEDAVKYKLADKVVYGDQVLASLKAKTGVDQKKDMPEIKLSEYVHAEHKEQEHSDGKIALIYAVGEIMGGEGDENEIGSEKLAETIRKARLDDKIKAIVLRVNSPGGSALASDVIWREVLLAKQKKPVIASFGDVAASGGYYIAAPADRIFAQPNTVTGSIGVFGLLPMLKEFWSNKLGITWDRVKTGKYADLGNPNREMSAEEEAIIQDYINRTYTEFKQRVAQGRKMPIELVDSLAQGRIYSGLQAKQNGLVDQLGNLQDAIDYAAKKANLKTYNLRILPQYKTKFNKIFRNMVMTKEDMLKEELGANYAVYKKAKAIEKMQGILMYYPFQISIY